MNNNISPLERRHIERLLGQGMKQSQVARIVNRSRVAISNIVGENRKAAESAASGLTRLRRTK